TLSGWRTLLPEIHSHFPQKYQLPETMAAKKKKKADPLASSAMAAGVIAICAVIAALATTFIMGT
ncbi:hypothetical protein OAF27_03250, partial [Verrucomicrobiales bacterium]|nr:hypothetical protein [Verrucomicrobiales bacterium]